MSEELMEVSIDTPVTQAEDTPKTKKYLYPYWSNRERRHLIVTVEYPNGKTNLVSIMDPEGTNPDMLAVLEQYTEEEIEANTEEGLRRRNENIKKAAERRESQAARAKQEILFNTKLEAFEIPAVKNSKNVEVKRLIRKAKSPMEVNAYVTIVLMRELDNAEKESE